MNIPLKIQNRLFNYSIVVLSYINKNDIISKIINSPELVITGSHISIKTENIALTEEISKVSLLFRQKFTDPLFNMDDNIVIDGSIDISEVDSLTVMVDHIAGWDSDSQSFSKFLQTSILRGDEYLSDFNQSLANNIIQSHSSALFLTSMRGKTNAKIFSYAHSDDYSKLYIADNELSSFEKQISLNPRITIHFELPEHYKHTEFNALIFEADIKTCEQSEIIAGIHRYENTDDDKLKYYEVNLVTFTYGSQSELEILRYEKQNNIVKETFTAVKLQSKYWTGLLRFPLIATSTIPVVLGISYAQYTGIPINLIIGALTIIGLLLLQIGINLIHDYYDAISLNDAYKFQSSFTGGSNYIQHGISSPINIFTTGLVLVLIGGSIGIYLNTYQEGNVIILLGSFGALLAIFYSANPLKLSHKGFGELITLIIYGILPTIASYYLQVGTLTNFNELMLLSLPIGILAALIVLINNLHDFEADVLVNKRTLVVRIGKKWSIQAYRVLMVLSFAMVIAFILNNILPVSSLIYLISLPIGIYTMLKLNSSTDDKEGLYRISNLTVIVHNIFGLMISLSLIFNTS